MPVMTEETVWQLLRGDQFTTPVLREWVPWLLRKMKDRSIIEELTQSGCEAGVLLADNNTLDKLVSEGIRKGDLAIDGRAARPIQKEESSPDKDLQTLDEYMLRYPDVASIHWNRALAWLQMGDFERGWPEYEWRWKRKEAVLQSFSQPLWDGSPLRGRTILLYAEQGLGDMLQFIRYAPLVKDQGGTVLVAAPLPVVRLLATCPGVDQVVTENEAFPPFDVRAPLMSLPGLFRTTFSTIPSCIPYLAAEPTQLERWRARLAAVPGIKVGIAWQGNPRHRYDRHRSFPVPVLVYFLNR